MEEIKLKLGEVLTINENIKNVIENKDLKLDALFKFRLLGIMKQFESFVNNFNVVRNEKVVEYGTKSDEDNKYKIDVKDKETMEKFVKDLSDVTNCEVSVNIEMLKAKDIFDIGLPSNVLMALYPIIKE